MIFIITIVFIPLEKYTTLNHIKNYAKISLFVLLLRLLQKLKY